MPNDNKPEQVESGHSPEPWVESNQFIFASSLQVATCHYRSAIPNARRIVACVNFCAGLDAKEMEGQSAKTWADEIDVLTEQEDSWDSELQSIRQKLAEAQKELMDLNNLCAEVSARAGVDRLAKVPDEIERLEKSAQQVKDLVPIVKRWEETCEELIKERDSLRAQLAKNKAARESDIHWVRCKCKKCAELRALIPSVCEHDIVFQPDEEGLNARGVPVCRKCHKEVE